LVVLAAAMLLISIGSLLALSAGATSAQENAKTVGEPRDVATIRSWMNRTIEFEDWYRLMALAKLMAGKGEYA